MAVKTVPLKDIKTFAARLKKARENTGLTAVAMAKRIGASHTAIGNWEKGISEPPLEYLVHLVKEFECDLNWLLLGRVHQRSVDDAGESGKEMELYKQIADLSVLLSKKDNRIEEMEKRVAEAEAATGPTALGIKSAPYLSDEEQ